MQQDKQTITDDMIQQAKAYPFEELLEFKRGYTKCPFHDDRTPSMSLKNNRIRCFSCNKTWDTIAYVMDKEGLTFPEAVRRLNA